MLHQSVCIESAEDLYTYIYICSLCYSIPTYRRFQSTYRNVTLHILRAGDILGLFCAPKKLELL